MINMSSDCISRQAAIDALKNRWKKTRNYEGYAEDPDNPNERNFFRPWDLKGPHYHSEVTAWMPLPEPYRP